MLDLDKASNLHTFIHREYGDQQYRGTLHDIEAYLNEDPIA